MTEMLQKSENVAKNVANKNSQDLTEQWKKGELPEGRYWVKIKTWCEYITMLYYTSDIFLDGDVPVDNDKIIEVLAPVPSYEEWKALNQNLDSTMQTNKALCKKLVEVKELLRIILSKTEICYSMVFQKDIINAELNEALLKKINEVLK
jgi:hypothetical protein